MTDRTSAGLASLVMRTIHSQFDWSSITTARPGRDVAWAVWKAIYEHGADFSPYDMYCGKEMVEMGLALPRPGEEDYFDYLFHNYQEGP